MRNASFLAILLLASASLLAQQNTTSSPTIFIIPPLNAGCPIDFTAQRRSKFELLPINAGQLKLKQWVQLSFSQSNISKVARIRVTAHGFSDKLRAIPANAIFGEDVTENFQLEHQPGEVGLFTSYLQTHNMGGVLWVEITGIDYADGSVWQRSKASQCRATPSGYLLANNLPAQSENPASRF
ncbi:hypothetical protein [Granulicella arctica]|uniref:Uncharacterized protein n=1 Tax=Granulicella arctica TaxID=940613 RepID=A0A7Y9PFV6_9BACT|nr:hypothetical protein [Granulicella arctica]NYF79177.1 hypothetical protein [Granulicella arctica]